MSKWLVGTHNGIVCIAINRDLFLWNPATRVHARLPTAETVVVPAFNLCTSKFGFGYSKATEEYKVLHLSQGVGANYITVVKVYSQKANSSKTIEGHATGLAMSPLKLLNGKLHFVVSPKHHEVKWDIIAFDLDSETCGMIEQPDYGDERYLFELGMLKDCICVLGKDSRQQLVSFVDLWVMKEYGIKESWTILAKIQFMDELGRYVILNPLIILPTGEILFMWRECLAIYDPKENVWTYLGIRDFRSFVSQDIYVESLVSPRLHAN